MSRIGVLRAQAATDRAGAAAALAGLLRDLFGLEARDVAINADQYSLNSLNGFFRTDGDDWFFKFHHEEGEEAMTGEYYRAGILQRAGLPVDQPAHASTEPGEQILVYRRRSEPRFADVLRALDLAPDPAAEARAVAAERDLGERLGAVYGATLHPITPADSAAEPIHRLFHDRLVEMPGRRYPGGRLASFYVGRPFAFPGATIGWSDFAAARIVVNGRSYRDTVGALFDAAAERLAPERLADAGGVTAHGDAHNANVWYGGPTDAPRLTLFDPAFAGEHVPALLAEVKATFHNVFAHPLWLYDPTTATERFRATADHRDGTLSIDTDWDLTPLRAGLLRAKAETVWRPLLADLAARGLLPSDWRRVIRLALFCCPTLVMNLRAGAAGHTPTSSAIGWAVAVMAGSEPVGEMDVFTDFLDAIASD